MLSRVSWQCQENFYPRPPRGGRHGVVWQWRDLHNFYPRPPRGGRQKSGPRYRAPVYFYPRPPRGGRREVLGVCLASLFISIHALREEGDQVKNCIISSIFNFYPRPLRGGRQEAYGLIATGAQFLSTPSARRATVLRDTFDYDISISIHALCEEGDVAGQRRRVRRRISIHALCEEGDVKTPGLFIYASNFYPRPLRGGRRQQKAIASLIENFYPRPLRGGRPITFSHRTASCDFYPRPLRGGRPCQASFVYSCQSFLSTPSARRATAKTETKSLFSNKLYNILHEFRRALIYNGSKSYPNHAK